MNQWLVVLLGAAAAGIVLYIAFHERLPVPQNIRTQSNKTNKKALTANAKFNEYFKNIRIIEREKKAFATEAGNELDAALAKKQRLEAMFPKAKKTDQTELNKQIDALDNSIKTLQTTYDKAASEWGKAKDTLEDATAKLQAAQEPY